MNDGTGSGWYPLAATLGIVAIIVLLALIFSGSL
jgi:hypothetical protein